MNSYVARAINTVLDIIQLLIFIRIILSWIRLPREKTTVIRRGIMKKTKGFLICLFCIAFLCSTETQAAERFTDNGDGTITDHYMQLMWTKADNNGGINWR